MNFVCRRLPMIARKTNFVCRRLPIFFYSLIAALVIGAASARAETIYVSSEKDNTISIIDGASLAVAATVKVGNRPRGIALSPDGRYLYICASDDNAIEVLDTAKLKIVNKLPSGPDPELLVVSPDGLTLFIANEDDNQVTVVDLQTRRKVAEIPVGVEPEGMAVSHDGRVVVNTSETTNMAHFIDAASGKITDNILVDQRPRFAEFTADDEEVWVTSEIGGSVAVIDNAARKIKKKITFAIPGVAREAIQPVGVRILKDRSAAFVALGPANRVAVINGRDFQVEDYILVGQRVWQLALSPDESRLYSTNGLSNDITIIDVKTRRPIKSVTVGRLPWGVAVK
jgi:PQQ-dependent catabolism-associated beta-propeller protein